MDMKPGACVARSFLALSQPVNVIIIVPKHTFATCFNGVYFVPLLRLIASDRLPDSSLVHLYAVSMAYLIGIGSRAGRKAVPLCSASPLDEPSRNPLLARSAGLSLHPVCDSISAAP
jgi:hypothetical protein